MKITPSIFVFLGGFLPSHGQEVVSPKWEVEILGPISDGTSAEPVAKPAPIDFKILTSHTKRVHVSEAPEFPDLPPVQGTINVTVQNVEDPGLPDPPVSPLLPATSLDDPPLIEQMEADQETAYNTSLLLISATVYDHSRTLVTISLSGIAEGGISAWSNLDFNHFSAFYSFRVTEANGTEREYALMMGIGNEEALPPDADQPQIPNLPDLPTRGPSFLVIQGDTQGEAIKLLTQLHDLYRKEGAQIEAPITPVKKPKPNGKPISSQPPLSLRTCLFVSGNSKSDSRPAHNPHQMPHEMDRIHWITSTRGSRRSSRSRNSPTPDCPQRWNIELVGI